MNQSNFQTWRGVKRFQIDINERSFAFINRATHSPVFVPMANHFDSCKIASSQEEGRLLTNTMDAEPIDIPSRLSPRSQML